MQTTTDELIDKISNTVVMSGGLNKAHPAEMIDALAAVLLTYHSMFGADVKSPNSAAALEHVADQLR